MKIVYLNPSEVQPYQNNPRINEKAVDGVVASLQEFGFQQPIVVDTDHVIIVGHTMWKAALKMSLPSIPILVAENLTSEQVKAYRLADNKTAEASQWDYEKLINEITDLTLLDIDTTMSGFSEKEIQEILGMNEVTVAGMVDDDETPDPEDVEHRVKPGDIWTLGDHRLVCGDATLPETYQKLMREDEQADIVLTDPPYNVDYEGKTADKLKIQNDKMGDGQLEARAYSVRLEARGSSLLQQGFQTDHCHRSRPANEIEAPSHYETCGPAGPPAPKQLCDRRYRPGLLRWVWINSHCCSKDRSESTNHRAGPEVLRRHYRTLGSLVW